ncbi:hypothetical protein DPMN_060227 [Dreissena polymorpha]|uniref:Uncharacterized protein n=1 Tax=Dreissena polymorpha TaxID=45954 RepID=A0A9D4HHA9_DREPO|nr:hypothetical protein DPMN_060227 [Dreissena polymorpha]
MQSLISSGECEKGNADVVDDGRFYRFTFRGSHSLHTISPVGTHTKSKERIWSTRSESLVGMNS